MNNFNDFFEETNGGNNHYVTKAGITSIPKHISHCLYQRMFIRNKIVIGDSVKTIEDEAFLDSNGLVYIVIGNNVTSIGKKAFADSNHLESIIVTEQNKNFCSVNNVLYDKMQNTLLCYPQKKSGISYTMPNSIKEIATQAFSGCSELEEVTFSNNINNIESKTMYNCANIKRIFLPKNEIEIASNAFEFCFSVEAIHFQYSKAKAKTIPIYFFEKFEMLKEITLSQELYDDIDNLIFHNKLDKKTLIINIAR